MPRMMAYLGGDTNTLACRRAKNNDIRLAVEYPDNDRMLVVCVMQTGEVTVGWTRVRGSEQMDYFDVVGKVVDAKDELVFIPATDQISDFIPPKNQPVTFNHTVLRVVPDDSEEEGDEAF